MSILGVYVPIVSEGSGMFKKALISGAKRYNVNMVEIGELEIATKRYEHNYDKILITRPYCHPFENELLDDMKLDVEGLGPKNISRFLSSAPNEKVIFPPVCIAIMEVLMKFVDEGKISMNEMITVVGTGMGSLMIRTLLRNNFEKVLNVRSKSNLSNCNIIINMGKYD